MDCGERDGPDAIDDGCGTEQRLIGRPVRSVAQATKLVHIEQFERELRAGVKLTVTISKPGYITKVTSLTIRKGKAPLRSDLCPTPGTAR